MLVTMLVTSIKENKFRLNFLAEFYLPGSAASAFPMFYGPYRALTAI